MKRKREPYEKNKKNKSLKLGESLETQKQLVPLSSSAPHIPDPTSITSTTFAEHSEPSKTIPPPYEPTSDPFEPIRKPSEPTPDPSEPIHKPSEPTSQPSEPDLTLPTIDEAFAKFSENSASRLRKLSDESRINDNPSEAVAEAAAKEETEKAVAEAEAREKAEAEATLAAEAARKAAKDADKASEVALTQGESSTSDLAPLFLKTLEDLQKEQQLVRSILNQQDQVNSSIHNLLA
ncbi:uncharacterized protein LOC127104582 [Lathyrus oleraceus]|uniref:uncharacterized protein LOC127104582 n=1 Tax=Pisum sativum TaxID=3888 RepID=UPI0021D29D2D|nr:uncharacterized protein LOC127104582 [Pisum sativum]